MSLTAEENDNLGDMLAAIEAENSSLNEWERGFVKDQLERHAKYGAGIRLSPKQWGAIRKIYFGITGSDGPDRNGHGDEDDYE